MVGVVAWVALVGGEMKTDTRDAIVSMGGPEKGHGLVVGTLFLVAVALRVLFILATAEAIKVLLDLRRGQGDLARKHEDLAARSRS